MCAGLFRPSDESENGNIVIDRIGQGGTVAIPARPAPAGTSPRLALCERRRPSGARAVSCAPFPLAILFAAPLDLEPAPNMLGFVDRAHCPQNKSLPLFTGQPRPFAGRSGPDQFVFWSLVRIPPQSPRGRSASLRLGDKIVKQVQDMNRPEILPILENQRIRGNIREPGRIGRENAILPPMLNKPDQVAPPRCRDPFGSRPTRSDIRNLA